MGASRCSVPGCKTTYGKGLIIRTFPKSEELAVLWTKSWPWPKSVPITKHTGVCELHFDSHQFEKVRVDGKKKFKWNAVPIFQVSEPQQSPASSNRTFGDAQIASEHSYHTQENLLAVTPDIPMEQKVEYNPDTDYDREQELITRVKIEPEEDLIPRGFNTSGSSFYEISEEALAHCLVKLEDPDSQEGFCGDDVRISSPTQTYDLDGNNPEIRIALESIEHTAVNYTEMELNARTEAEESMSQVISAELNEQNIVESDQEKMKRQDLVIRRLQKQIIEKDAQVRKLQKAVSSSYALQCKYRALAKSHRRLQEKFSTCLQSIHPMLREDQTRALLRKNTRGLKWSSESIKEGLLLKKECGTAGYAALVKRLPVFPSVRCLQEHVRMSGSNPTGVEANSEVETSSEVETNSNSIEVEER